MILIAAYLTGFFPVSGVVWLVKNTVNQAISMIELYAAQNAKMKTKLKYLAGKW